jgi:hypothetical protein
MGRLENAVQLADAVHKTSVLILTRTCLTDPLIMVCLLVFVAGFSRLIRQVRGEYDWLAPVLFGAGLIVLMLELCGDALAGGAALDASTQADPTVVRGLWEGSIVFYGVIGLMMSTSLLATAGCATLLTGILPRWSGWAACAAAAINLMAAPSIFEGTGVTGFYTANGYVTSIAQAVMLIWFLIASVTLIALQPQLRAEASVGRSA